MNVKIKQLYETAKQRRVYFYGGHRGSIHPVF